MKANFPAARVAKTEIFELLKTVSDTALIEGCKIYRNLMRTEKNDLTFYKALKASLKDLETEMTLRGMEI